MVCAYLVFLFAYTACMCVRRRARECVCSRRRDYEWERCGGFASLQGGGEVDFFSHPFFMAFLLSDLQSLYIRLTGRFSFIFKHLLGTRCVCLVAFWGGGGGGLMVAARVKVETCCFSSSPNDDLTTPAAQMMLICGRFHGFNYTFLERLPKSKYSAETMWICVFSTD